MFIGSAVISMSINHPSPYRVVVHSAHTSRPIVAAQDSYGVADSVTVLCFRQVFSPSSTVNSVQYTVYSIQSIQYTVYKQYIPGKTVYINHTVNITPP